MKIVKSASFDSYVITKTGAKFSVYPGMKIKDEDQVVGNIVLVNFKEEENSLLNNSVLENLENLNPDEILTFIEELPETAAGASEGTSVPLSDGSSIFVSIERTGNEVQPNAGYDTIGIDGFFERPELFEDIFTFLNEQNKETPEYIPTFRYARDFFKEDFEGITQDNLDTNINRNWYVDHGEQGDDILISNDNNEWIMNEAGVEVRKSGGVHRLDTNNDSDTYIELDAHTRGLNSEIKTSIELGNFNVFKLSFDMIPRPNAKDSSDMFFKFGEKEINIEVDRQGNLDITNPSNTKIEITENDNGWNTITAYFVNPENNELSFAASGKADTLGAYIDNIKMYFGVYSSDNINIDNNINIDTLPDLSSYFTNTDNITDF